MTFSFEHVDTVSMDFTFTANRAKKCIHNLMVVVKGVALDIAIEISRLALFCPLHPLAPVRAH
jgi:hypothetical protein